VGRLDGKRVIVVGGASGMGDATVRACAREGAAVVLMDIDDDGGQAVARAAAGDVTYRHCDLSHKDEVTSCFAEATEALGGLDVLAVPAGVWCGGPAEQQSPTDLARMIEVNLYGTVYANQAAYGPMRDGGGGSIINFGSSAGMKGEFRAGAYSASKGAVLAWTRVIASEWGRDGIRANAMAPAIRTPMYEKSSASLSEAERVARDRALASRMLLGDTLGDPDQDFAPAMVFLAGDDSRFITGQTIAVNGGLLFVR
jgi:NAD(P)-dependent dehydrogenase (short-subunit alcohol dehydrogenase family)